MQLSQNTQPSLLDHSCRNLASIGTHQHRTHKAVIQQSVHQSTGEAAGTALLLVECSSLRVATFLCLPQDTFIRYPSCSKHKCNLAAGTFWTFAHNAPGFKQPRDRFRTWFHRDSRTPCLLLLCLYRLLLVVRPEPVLNNTTQYNTA